MEVGNVDAEKIPPRVTNHTSLGRISSLFAANGESIGPRSSESAETRCIYHTVSCAAQFRSASRRLSLGWSPKAPSAQHEIV